MSWTGIALFVQLFFGIVIGLYFWNLLKNQRTQKVSIDRESRKEMDQLKKKVQQNKVIQLLSTLKVSLMEKHSKVEKVITSH